MQKLTFFKIKKLRLSHVPNSVKQTCKTKWTERLNLYDQSCLCACVCVCVCVQCAAGIYCAVQTHCTDIIPPLLPTLVSAYPLGTGDTTLVSAADGRTP